MLKFVMLKFIPVTLCRMLCSKVIAVVFLDGTGGGAKHLGIDEIGKSKFAFSSSLESESEIHSTNFLQKERISVEQKIPRQVVEQKIARERVGQGQLQAVKTKVGKFETKITVGKIGKDKPKTMKAARKIFRSIAMDKLTENKKELVLIRHAVSIANITHANINKEQWRRFIKSKDYDPKNPRPFRDRYNLRDCLLSTGENGKINGYSQASAVKVLTQDPVTGSKFVYGEHIPELIVVSPMRRTLLTLSGFLDNIVAENKAANEKRKVAGLPFLPLPEIVVHPDLTELSRTHNDVGQAHLENTPQDFSKTQDEETLKNIFVLYSANGGKVNTSLITQRINERGTPNQWWEQKNPGVNYFKMSSWNSEINSGHNPFNPKNSVLANFRKFLAGRKEKFIVVVSHYVLLVALIKQGTEASKEASFAPGTSPPNKRFSFHPGNAIPKNALFDYYPSPHETYGVTLVFEPKPIKPEDVKPGFQPTSGSDGHVGGESIPSETKPEALSTEPADPGATDPNDTSEEVVAKCSGC